MAFTRIYEKPAIRAARLQRALAESQDRVKKMPVLRSRTREERFGSLTTPREDAQTGIQQRTRRDTMTPTRDPRGSDPGGTGWLGDAYNQVNQRVFKPSELVGGRISESLGWGQPLNAQIDAVRSLSRGDVGGAISQIPRTFPGAAPQQDREDVVRLPGDIRAAGEAIIGGRRAGERQDERLSDIGMTNRFIGAAVIDPTNLIGAGVATKAVRGGRAVSRLGRANLAGRAVEAGAEAAAKRGFVAPQGFIPNESGTYVKNVSGINVEMTPIGQTVAVDLFREGESSSLTGLRQAIDEVNQAASQNPERIFRADVQNEQLASLMVKRGVPRSRTGDFIFGGGQSFGQKARNVIESEVGELRLGDDMPQRAPTYRQPTNEGMLVQSDALRPADQINKEYKALTTEIRAIERAGKVKRPSGPQTSEAARLGVQQARLEAEADIHRILASGGSIDDQTKAIDDELRAIGIEDEERYNAININRAGANREWAPTWYRDTKDVPKVRPRTKHQPVGVRGREFGHLTSDELEARASVFNDVLNSLRYEPDSRPLRARMGPTGELSTEQVLTGDPGQQGLLGISAGERPIETAGPMFRQSEIGGSTGIGPEPRGTTPQPPVGPRLMPYFEGPHQRNARRVRELKDGLASPEGLDEGDIQAIRREIGERELDNRNMESASRQLIGSEVGGTSGIGPRRISDDIPPSEPPIGDVPPPREPPPGDVPPPRPTEPSGTGRFPDKPNFVQPLRPWAEVDSEIVTSDNPLVRGATRGVNPNVRASNPAQKMVAVQTNRVIESENNVQTILAAGLDSHAQRMTGRMPVQVDDAGTITNLKSRPGQSLAWNDVFENYTKYDLTPGQRDYIEDFLAIVDQSEQLRIAEGLPRRGRKAVLDEVFWAPRQVRNKRGIELKRPSNANYARRYEEAQDGIKRGIQYDNPRAALELHLRQVYGDITAKDFRLAQQNISKSPVQMLSSTSRNLAKGAGKRLQGANNLIKVLQRAKRGESIPTGTIQAAERALPELAGTMDDNLLRVTIDDLVEAGVKAGEPDVVLPPVQAGTLRKLTQAAEEAAAAAAAEPRNGFLQKASRKANSRLGFAKYRMARQLAEDPDFVDGFTLTKNAVKILKGEKRATIDALIERVRGTPYEALTATGTKTTRFRGGLMDDLAKEARQTKGKLTDEMRPYREGRVETAKGELFGSEDDEIAVGMFRNRYYPRDQAEYLAQKQGDRTSDALGALSNVSDVRRASQTGFDIGTMLTVGQTGIFQNLPRLPEIAARMVGAFIDPTMHARFIRENLEGFQWLARHGMPAGDTEFYAALRSGNGTRLGRMLGPARKPLREVGRNTIGRGAASYDALIGTMRLYLREAATSLPEAEAARWIRNVSGGLNTAALGANRTQRIMENLFLAFAPKFFRSQMTLISDATKLGTPQGRKAAITLSRQAAGMAGVYVAAGLLLGKSKEEIKKGLDPGAGANFLAYQDKEGRFWGWGGPLRSFAQAVYQAGAAAAPGGKPADDLWTGDNPILGFFANRGAPGVSVGLSATEALTGANTYPYRDIDNLGEAATVTAKESGPFWAPDLARGDFGAAGAGFVGARVSDPNAYRQFVQAFQETAGHEYNPESAADRQLVKTEPSLKSLQEAYQGVQRERESETRLQADETNKIITEAEQDQGMSRLAESIVSGNSAAAANYNDARADYLSYRAGIYKTRFDNLPDPETKVGKLTEEYQTLNPKSPEYTDENGEVDWDAYQTEKDRLLKRLPVGDQAALKAADKFKDPNLNKVEREFQKAKAVVDKFYDTPKYKGLSFEEGEALDDLVNEGVNAVQTRQIQLVGEPYPVDAAIIIAAKKTGASPNVLRYALMFRKKATKAIFTLPARDKILTDNQDLLGKYYPDLLAQQFSREEEAGLSEDVLSQLIGAR